MCIRLRRNDGIAGSDPGRGRNSNRGSTIQIHNTTTATIILREMNRCVVRDPEKLKLEPGGRKALPMQASGTYVRMGAFRKAEGGQEENLGVFLDTDEIAGMRAVAIRYDDTTKTYSYLRADEEEH